MQMKPEYVKHILGTGGAFDVEEGNSSFIIEWPGLGLCLIDCGYDVYAKLREADLTSVIDYVFITHMHDDHIGSLSSLIYHRHFVHNQRTTVVTSPTVGGNLRSYLKMLGHKKVQYDITTDIDTGTAIYLMTDGLHVPGMPSCGFLFKDGTRRMVYSGDIGIPIMDVVKVKYNEEYHAMMEEGSETDVFQDVSMHYNHVHCYHEDVYALRNVNMYTYHHTKGKCGALHTRARVYRI